jgi:hypothetical protein
MYEEVRGTIIGPVTRPYEFWSLPKHSEVYFLGTGKVKCIARNFFENDDEAIAWVKEHHPEAFRLGLEMRVFE